MFMQRFFYLVISGFSFFSIFPALAHGAQANFSWLPNTEENLAGYEIHYGTSSENYTTVIDAGLPDPVDGRIHATVDDLAEGNTYYFAAIAYDGNGIESDFSEEVSYTVTPSEPLLPPVANDLAVNTTEDTPVTDQLRVDNSGGLPLQYTVISATSPGTLTLEDATGSFTYTPAPDFNGTDSFTFTATNDNGESNIAIVEIVINPANDAPVAVNGAFTTDEDITVNGQLEAEDPDGDYLSYVLVTAPTQGTAEVDSNGSFTYTPAENTTDTGSFSFKVNDGSVDSPVATVTITINPVNDTPVAHPATFTTQEDTVVSGQLAADDPDGDTLTYTMMTSPAQGTVSMNSNGSFTYTPAENNSGTDSFSFKVNDGSVDSPVATVTITINPVNDTPVAHPATFTTQEDTVVSGQLAANDPDGDTLTYTMVTNPAQGTASVNSNGSFTYTPAENSSGTDSFSYKVNDGSVDSPAATVTITVNPVNDAPVAFPATFTTQEETVVNGQLAANDPDGDTLTYTMVTSPAQGTISLNSSGSFTYTPAANSSGTDSFSYKVNDGFVNSAPATVTINVNPVNDAPIAFPATFSTQEDTVKSGQLAANDPDGDTLTYTMVTNPAQGTASVNSSGSFTYAPAANYSGTDSFSYKVNDGFVNSAPATVTITVNPVNDAPVAENSAITVEADTATSGRLNATDAEEEPLTYFLASSPNQGTLTINPDGAFTYTADKDGSGTDSFSFQADDGANTSNIATVSITITPTAPSLALEAGEVDVDHNWIHVDFDGAFTDPVVIARLISKNDSEPCLVRVDSVTSTGFNLRLQEYDYLDDIHPVEQVSFIVMEAGHYTLSDGTQLEAGSSTIQAIRKYDHVGFSQQFSTTPVVITTIASENEQDAVTTRIRNIDQAGFECLLQEQQRNQKKHAPETVNYLAWEPSTGVDNGIRYEVATTGNSITHETTTVAFTSSFSHPPLVVTDMQTTNNVDTSTLRTLQVSSLDLQIAVEEEQSKDSETEHTSEDAGFIAILSE